METRTLVSILTFVLTVLIISSCAITPGIIKTAERGDSDKVKRFIEAGVDVNARSCYEGWTALISASVLGHTEVARLLIEEGADVNAKIREVSYLIHSTRDKFYTAFLPSTALMSASSWGHTEIVKLLIESGADVNYQDEEGYTALEWASWKKHPEIVELLKEAGARNN